MNLGQQRATERPAGLPGRLRSFFGPGRAKRPEPRVRYGQLFLPGLAVFGRQHVNEARPLLERADAIRTRRFTYLGRTLVFPARIDWEPGGLSERWSTELNSLEELLALGVAAVLALEPEGRQAWYGGSRRWRSASRTSSTRRCSSRPSSVPTSPPDACSSRASTHRPLPWPPSSGTIRPTSR